MSRIRRAIPSPALAVAVLALGAALGGSAIADVASTSVSKKKTKKIAKQQANKAIDQRESSLNVNSAKTADSAGTAGDAQTLDGLDSKQLGPGVFVDSGTNVNLGATDATVVSTTITVPTDATLLAAGTVELQGDGGDNDVPRCLIRIDGVNGLSYSAGIPETSSDDTTLSVVGGRSVGAGTHAVDLRCSSTGNVHTDEQGMTVSGHL